jgi:hypothetical protein
MKKQELRQLIREIIVAEVSIGPDGSLKGAKGMFDDFEDMPKEFPAWYSGFQKGMNAIKSAPEGAQVQKHLKALRELGSETVDMLRFLAPDEIERLFSKIPGDSVEDKGIIAMIGIAQNHYEEQGEGFLFDTFVMPHIRDKFPPTDDLMEGLGKRLKDVGAMFMDLIRRKRG